MKALDWLTMVLVGLGLLTLIMSRFARNRAVQRYSNLSPTKGALSLILAALLLQYFRGFDLPVQNEAFGFEEGGVNVTGILENRHQFKLNAVVVDIALLDERGDVIQTGKTVVKEIASRSSSPFTAHLKTDVRVARVRVTAEGFWT
jgi:hypothetical protein